MDCLMNTLRALDYAAATGKGRTEAQSHLTQSHPPWWFGGEDVKHLISPAPEDLGLGWFAGEAVSTNQSNPAAAWGKLERELAWQTPGRGELLNRRRELLSRLGPCGLPLRPTGGAPFRSEAQGSQVFASKLLCMSMLKGPNKNHRGRGHTHTS